MTPIGTQHSEVVNRLTEWSFEVTAGRHIRVRVQNPIRIPPNDSEPEPDVVWVADKDYSKSHPGPEDILFVVEVAESSLDIDRGTKLAIYAEAGIAEYWIANLIDEQIEVYRNPVGRTYQDNSICRGDDSVHPLAVPDAALRPARLFAP